MRLHDRRAIFAALMLVAAYLALGLTLILQATGRYHAAELGVPFVVGVAFCTALLVWRLTWRAAIVSHIYGWAEGFRSIPRAVVSNLVAILAAWRAVAIYRSMRRDGIVRWDKTAHRFPSE